MRCLSMYKVLILSQIQIQSCGILHYQVRDKWFLEVNSHFMLYYVAQNIKFNYRYRRNNQMMFTSDLNFIIHMIPGVL